ncbi:HEAT repeat domain-containing protein [Candidatus Latescibacterota bacterium]
MRAPTSILARCNCPIRVRLGGPLLLALLAAVACGRSAEDMVDSLSGDAEERASARQELLLSKERAVEPLLAALADPALASSRTEYVDVLVSLMMRVEDPRIVAALSDHLRTDLDPRVRARIARAMGMHRRLEGAEELLASLDDEDGEVRHQAILALGSLEGKLDSVQAGLLESRVGSLVSDTHPGVQLEAMIRREAVVGRLLKEASEAVLQAQSAEAESLYHGALAYAPTSKRAKYRQARYYYDNGDEGKGMALLRQFGMLLDVPRLPTAPRIDGHLNEPAWKLAAAGDSLFQFSFSHAAALPSERPSRFLVGYTDEAVFVGFHGYDPHPDSLVAKIQDVAAAETYEGGPVASGQSIWTDDIIELFFDPGFDHAGFAHAGINSKGVAQYEYWRGRPGVAMRSSEGRDEAWHPASDVAAHVGADFWTVEFQMDFNDPDVPRPRAGDVWGFNLVRVYRGQEYNQWVRTYSGGLSPDDFGVLVFH